MNPYDLSAGLFIRALTNLKAQLAKAEAHVASAGARADELLGARLGTSDRVPNAAVYAPRDLHMYTLADQVHWAAEGARLAIGRLLGEEPVPAANDATSFSALRGRVDATIAYLGSIAPSDLASGLDRTIVIEHPRGTVRAGGRRFLIAYAIPHFFYHVTAAYGILRNQGVALTMADYLGNWAAT